MSKDYYTLLDLPPTATPIQIKTAYKKAALRWHPDRVPTDSPERAERTRRFQHINDAYYTLSDEGRRRDYDAARQWGSHETESEWEAEEEVPRPGGGGAGSKTTGGGGASVPWSAFGFGGKADDGDSHQPRTEKQWSSAFEEMMNDADWSDGAAGASPHAGANPATDPVRTGKFWSIVGSLSGATLGFIVANWPGAVAGGAAGNRLGAVRDKHGKSVYEVYRALPQADKARLLAELATKIFAQTLSG